MWRTEYPKELREQEVRWARWRTAFYLVLAFCTPAILLLSVYASYGMAPFGDNSILIMDLSGQYVEFYCGLKHLGKTGDFFFSWSKSLGTNYTGVFAYYLSSPLSFLTLLCPNVWMPVGLLFLNALKLGLAGLTMAFYLRSKFGKIDGFTVLFSTFYGMMSYCIVYSMCLMWLDGVIWLPVILMGVEKLLREGKIGLLTVSLTAMFLSNYYIAYMVGLFTALYFLTGFWVGRSIRRDWRLFGKKCLQFLSSTFVSALLGAWLLLPTFYSLLEGKIGGYNYTTDKTINFEWGSLPSKLFLGGYDSITNSGMPFLYCGVLVTILFLGFFFLRNVSMRAKLFAAGFAGFLLLSLQQYKLDFAWHIFQNPNWFPYRYSFLLSFLMIVLAYYTLRRLQDLSPSYFLGFLFAGGLVALLVKRIKFSFLTEEEIKLTCYYALLYIVALLLLRALWHHRSRIREQSRRLVTGLLTLAVFLVACGELRSHSLALVEGLDRAHYYETLDSYQEYTESMDRLLTAAEEREEEESFYRVFTDFGRSFNESIGLGFSGMGHYSSAYNRDVNSYVRKLGFASSYLWTSSFGSTLVSESLLAGKYVISLRPEHEDYLPIAEETFSMYRKPEDLPMHQDSWKVTLYENPYALSVGFQVPSHLPDKLEFSGNQFDYQDALLSAFCDRPVDCFRPVSARQDQEAKLTYLDVEEDGILYAYFPGNNNRQCSLFVNGVYLTDLYRSEFDGIVYLGHFSQEDQVELRFSQERTKQEGNLYYLLSVPELEAASAQLAQGEMEVLSYSAGRVEGIVRAQEDCLLYTSIPYHEAWEVRVDGKRVETKCFEEMFLCFPLSQGEHQVELVYRVPGRTAGITLSCVTLVAVVLAALLPKVVSYKKEQR